MAVRQVRMKRGGLRFSPTGARLSGGRALSTGPSARRSRGRVPVGGPTGMGALVDASSLVDPASSHMLVSKIKPCMSKYRPRHGETADGSLNRMRFIRPSQRPRLSDVDNCGNSRANTCTHKLRPPGKSAFIRPKPAASVSSPRSAPADPFW